MAEEQQTPEDPTQDPHFVPADSPDFIPFPVEPSMGVDGPTDQGAPDLGYPPDDGGLPEDGEGDV